MEGLTTYSKLSVYPQPYTGSPNNSIAYSHVGYTPVGYTAATDSVPQLRSTHLEQNVGEPHLDDCGITPSPSESSSSRSPAENSTSKDAIFLSSNFERLNKDGVHGSHHTSGASSIPAHGITVNLLDKELWKMFNSIGNELIVTKPGR